MGFREKLKTKVPARNCSCAYGEIWVAVAVFVFKLSFNGISERYLRRW